MHPDFCCVQVGRLFQSGLRVHMLKRSAVCTARVAVTHTPHIKFVLLSTVRSGTTALVSAMRRHPDVLAHHAIFGDPVDKTVKLAFRKRNDVVALRKNPTDFVEKILSFATVSGSKCGTVSRWRPVKMSRPTRVSKRSFLSAKTSLPLLHRACLRAPAAPGTCRRARHTAQWTLHGWLFHSTKHSLSVSCAMKPVFLMRIAVCPGTSAL